MTLALVTGATGQDGLYLCRQLAQAGVQVLAGRLEPSPRDRYLAHPLITPLELDITDTARFASLLRAHRVDEVYNLAALSSVAHSWDDPRATASVNADAVDGMLAAIRHVRPGARFFQASSVQAGTSSPYASSKLAAEGLVADARAAGVFAVCGRLANHESPLRPAHFVSRRIARAAAAGEALDLGALDAERDWGHARDHVAAMPMLLRLAHPLDADICTGVIRPLRDLVHAAYRAAGLPVDELVVESGGTPRPEDPASLGGDPTALRRATGWAARTSIDEMMAEMVAVERVRLATGLEDVAIEGLAGFEAPR